MRTQKKRDEIFEKFPKLYNKKADPDGRKYPIYYGFECNDGWLPLIEDLSESIQFYVDKMQRNDPNYPQPYVLQCKEKFGALRFYVTPHDDHIDGMVRMAEKVSARTCEMCGNSGTMNREGWWKVLCSPCLKERNEKRNSPFEYTTDHSSELTSNKSSPE